MDDGFDPCEYVWSHEMAMRRLLSLLRHSQAYCTDTECFNEYLNISVPGSNINTSDGNVLFVFCWFFVAIALYFLRSAVFRRREDNLKFRDNEHDSSGESSAPPPLC
ncbi:UNVERIFIED_CONTAM: hypothetical protein PYX00_005461 [Menopon gallinae]|uniref:Small integral membrane protein 14 n=1 Tax=Menopon gallinae TaxID=328185 RepID=A0AAW2HSU5_9NEOP